MNHISGSSENAGKPTVSGDVLKLVERFADKAQDIVPYSSIYLFGSHAKGCAHEHSDVDVAILVEEISGFQEDNTVYRKPYFELNEMSYDYRPIDAHLVQTRHIGKEYVEAILNTGILIKGPRIEQQNDSSKTI